MGRDLTIRVLIVDDSAVVRKVLTEIIDAQGDMEVVGVAADPYIARTKIRKFDPDVVTLDIEMPRMDGLAFLEALMNFRPLPVIMVSSYSQKGAEVTLKALALGAVDFLPKPGTRLVDVKTLAEELVEKVRTAATAKVRRVSLNRLRSTIAEPASQQNERSPKPAPSSARINVPKMPFDEGVICIGASLGGTNALEFLFEQVQNNLPGIVVVQHMPKGFTAAFAKRVNSLVRAEVLEAEDKLGVHPGRIIIAAGGHHLVLEKNKGSYRVRINTDPEVRRHRPSVDVLFQSAASCAGKLATGVLLTGMGEDGARGLKAMRDAGAWTIAQDEATSVVWGMPGAAVELGAAKAVVPLHDIGPMLMQAHQSEGLRASL